MGKKDTKKDTVVRSRNWFIELYMDDPLLKAGFDKLISGFKSYAYITHNKDVSSDGQLKKSHVHFILSLENAVTNVSLSKKLFGTVDYVRFIQKVSKMESTVQYLVHKNDLDKYQYNFSDIQFSEEFYPILEKYMNMNSNGKNDEECFMEIFEFIEDNDCMLSISDVIRYAMDSGFYSTLRKNFYMINTARIEHNRLISCNITTREFRDLNEYEKVLANAGKN